MKVHLGVCTVQRYKAPGYLDKERAKVQPELLEPVQARWKRRPALCAALDLPVPAGLRGCTG